MLAPSFYTLLLRRVLFSMEPEQAHEFVFRCLERWPQLAQWATPTIKARQQVQVFGLSFANPLGLAAGLDKDARLLHVWQKLGFGFVEVGTITPLPQEGNPKPRLFRLPKDSALINRMGFNSAGLEAMAQQLAKRPPGLIVGANLGKNLTTSLENVVVDYLRCLERLHALADYFVINVSSPNTPGLLSLQEKEPLLRLLARLQEYNQRQHRPKPLLIKISPDLAEHEMYDVVQVVKQVGFQGVVATNTSLHRQGLRTPAEKLAPLHAGGLSGKPLRQLSYHALRYLHNEGIRVIAVGGIFDGDDARERLGAGASLVQVYTGFIYQGPALIKDVLRRLY